MTASLHWRTPSLAVIDGRGLPIRQVAYLRTLAEDTPSAFATCQDHDVAGRVVAQRDPRLLMANTTTVYALNGAAVFTDSVDSGWRLVLPGLAGEPRQRWDERGHHWESTFDTQLRVTTLKEVGDARIDSFSYGKSSADAGHNLRGQLIKQADSSGSLDITSYALTGQALVETRTFDDGKAFTSQQVFSPLGAVLQQIDAGGHRKASRYGLAGQLKKVELEVATKVTQVLQDAHYNANSQIISQLAGNGVLRQWTYDPADGRLDTRTSQKPGQARLQDLAYFYDRVGNIIRIEDHAFEPTWFANQRVDGHREFIYDSLYRLIRATGYDDALPPDIPGLPQPTDPKNRRNYTQTYTYDKGGNLIELCHQRDEGCRTRRMHIDSESNRAVRRETGDDEPDFGNWFDLHGNQSRLRHGPTLHWNNRDELEHIDLVIRKDSANDTENYRYSQGVRVLKYRETVARGVSHIDKVRYLPGLEIRSKDNGEELHIISVGNARCLHWVSNPPAANTQLRYTLEDHLGSCVMELNEEAVITSEEGYYPFGETAWMAPESEIEYRFIRYSGKEMDASGLYYYGARYYAPWLQRWVSADPAGDVDGLNLYGFVGNNPLTYLDDQGRFRLPFAIIERWKTSFGNGDPASSFDLKIFRHLELLDEVTLGVRDTAKQILNHRHAKNHAKSSAERTTFTLAEKGVSTIATAGVGALLGTPGGPLGMLAGAAAGLLFGKAISTTTGYIGKKTGASTSINLQSGRLNPDKILKKIRSETSDRYLMDTLSKWLPTNEEGRKNLGKEVVVFAAKKVPLAGQGLSMGFKVADLLEEVNAAGKDLTEKQFNELDNDIVDMMATIERGTGRLLALAESFNRSRVLGYSMERIKEKSEKRVNMLKELRVLLHSGSKKGKAA
ncbi:RHS repeat-associated core domain-containing protein [Pseudomonas iranensis]|uniref:RHS repeat domain-containing protein n=1 Tax=Pseudomonas iranensis TaxID=2745503 RepID=UPI00164928B9|nr:RHS repeat-associated core domain-containing protein [Pseudomonas iranensis]QXI21715.1 RHS repeat-associated core domain-containing protein [Pseudomonas iranensis]